MSFISVAEEVFKDIEVWAMTIEQELVIIAKAIIVAEKQTITLQIMPLIKNAAINLQNESPGLNASNFIPALVAAVIPILPEALKDLEVTAISTFASVVAGQLNVPNAKGNAGVFINGSSNSASNTINAPNAIAP